jgi:hypothetical protein
MRRRCSIHLAATACTRQSALPRQMPRHGPHRPGRPPNLRAAIGDGRRACGRFRQAPSDAAEAQDANRRARGGQRQHRLGQDHFPGRIQPGKGLPVPAPTRQIRHLHPVPHIVEFATWYHVFRARGALSATGGPGPVSSRVETSVLLQRDCSRSFLCALCCLRGNRRGCPPARAKTARGVDATRRKPNVRFPDQREWELLETQQGTFLLCWGGTFLLCRDRGALTGCPDRVSWQV